MMLIRRWKSLAVSTALVASLAACRAVEEEHVEREVVTVTAESSATEAKDPPFERQSVPGPGELTSPVLQAGRAEGEPIHIEAREGGWKLVDLFRFVHDETGISILYDHNTQPIQATKVEFVGAFDVPAGRLFEWLQAVLAYHNIALVPIGPLGETGRQWSAMDTARPALQSRPLFVHFDEVARLADRDGLFVTTVIPLADGVDANRLRSALSQLSSRTAAIGKVVSVDDPPSLVVTDWAPVVAQMCSVVRQMGAEYRGE